jgi:molybdenum cofactor biosynthesis enzyme MoaA
VDHLHWTGGEPTLRGTDLVKDIRFASLMGMHQSMATNGTASIRFYGDLVDAGLNRINVSLDSMDTELFQVLTGQTLITPEEIWNKVAWMAQNVDLVKINVVVTSRNLHEVKSIYKEAILHRNTIPRFLEFAPFAGSKLQTVTVDKILDELRPFEPEALNGICFTNPTAEYYRRRCGLFGITKINLSAQSLDVKYTSETGKFSIVKYI